MGAYRWHGFPITGYYGAARVYLGCPAERTSYGAGFAGTLGVPTLAASDDPALGATFTLTADNSLGAATMGVLLVGDAAVSIVQRSGATLLVDWIAVLPIAIPATGFADPVTIPADPALCFLDLFLQIVELDGGAVGGLSWTQGVELSVGFDV